MMNTLFRCGCFDVARVCILAYLVSTYHSCASLCCATLSCASLCRAALANKVNSSLTRHHLFRSNDVTRCILRISNNLAPLERSELPVNTSFLNYWLPLYTIFIVKNKTCIRGCCFVIYVTLLQGALSSIPEAMHDHQQG